MKVNTAVFIISRITYMSETKESSLLHTTVDLCHWIRGSHNDAYEAFYLPGYNGFMLFFPTPKIGVICFSETSDDFPQDTELLFETIEFLICDHGYQ
jgi:hypothetical protein